MTDAPVLEVAQVRRSPRRLGDVLVARGVVSEHDLLDVLEDQRQWDGNDRMGSDRLRLGALLVQHGLASEEQVASALAELLGREVVDASSLAHDPSWARLLPRPLAERCQMLVLGPGDRGLRVLAADPTDVLALDDVRRHSGVQQLDVLVAIPSQLRALLDRVWSLEAASDVVASVRAAAEPQRPREVDVAVVDAPTVRLLDSLLADAVRARASDVHVEHQVDSVRVRYRVDGVLRDVMSLPIEMGRTLTARIKIVANMDIAERRVPQDGRVRLTIDGRLVDARVSTLPSVHGEKAVIRLLPAASAISRLADLGMDPQQQGILVRTLESPQGLVLITGPTGSGKTNTLYAAIAETMSPERNVITLEDPVEIELPGITQVPIDDKTGMTFVRGLRALLRQDPDVVLVGEVRDTLTAELALRAAMTGHLVLTTLHTNDAPAALPRLVDMGVPPYLVASALSLVVSQRLVRVPCSDCVVPYVPDEETLTSLGVGLPPGSTPMQGAGCGRCQRSGYLGRRAIFEVLEVTSALRRALLGGADEAALADLAAEDGFRGLRDQGLELAARGGTTYEEVLRVTRAQL